MPRFFYTENNHRQHRPIETFWGKFAKRRQKRKAELKLQNISKLKNPYDSSSQKHGFNKSKLSFIFLALILIAWVGLILYYPFFQIKQISYNGLKIIKTTEISDQINDYLDSWSIWPKRNYFFINTNHIKSIIEKNFSINKLKINKIFPNQLKIEVTEKISSIIYDSGEEYYLLDNSGTIIKDLGIKSTTENDNFISDNSTATTTKTVTTTTSSPHLPDLKIIKKEYGGYPIIYGKEKINSIQIGTKVLEPEIVPIVLQLSEQLPKRGIGEVNYFIIGNPAAGLEATMTGRPGQISISVYGDIDLQLNNIKTILQTNHPNEYIDVRFGERVFWK